MNLIKAIRVLFEENPEPYQATRAKCYLRRGTMEQIRRVRPSYMGETVLCLDEPYLAVGGPTEYVLIPIPEEAKESYREHYNRLEFDPPQITW